LVVRAHEGKPEPPDATVEVAAREGQEIVVVRHEALSRLWRVTVPIWEGTRSVGAVSLTLPLARADALARRIEHQAVLLGVTAMCLLVGALSAFMNRALAAPLGRILQVMGGRKAGISARGLPRIGKTRSARWRAVKPDAGAGGVLPGRAGAPVCPRRRHSFARRTSD